MSYGDMEIHQNMYPPLKEVPQAPIKEVEALLLGSKVLPDGSTYLKPFDDRVPRARH